MKSIRQCLGRNILWTFAPGSTEAYELREGDEVVGTLSLLSAAGPLVEGACAEGTWTFRRVGFFSTHITVRAEGCGENLAVFTPTVGGGGSLAFAGGATFTWTPRSSMAAGWDFVAQDGFVLVSARPLTDNLPLEMARIEGQTEVSLAGASVPQLPVLVLLAWYLFVVNVRDTARAAAITASLGG